MASIHGNQPDRIDPTHHKTAAKAPSSTPPTPNQKTKLPAAPSKPQQSHNTAETVAAKAAPGTAASKPISPTVLGVNPAKTPKSVKAPIPPALVAKHFFNKSPQPPAQGPNQAPSASPTKPQPSKPVQQAKQFPPMTPFVAKLFGVEPGGATAAQKATPAQGAAKKTPPPLPTLPQKPSTPLPTPPKKSAQAATPTGPQSKPPLPPTPQKTQAKAAARHASPLSPPPRPSRPPQATVTAALAAGTATPATLSPKAEKVRELLLQVQEFTPEIASLFVKLAPHEQDKIFEQFLQIVEKMGASLFGLSHTSVALRRIQEEYDKAQMGPHLPNVIQPQLSDTMKKSLALYKELALSTNRNELETVLKKMETESNILFKYFGRLVRALDTYLSHYNTITSKKEIREIDEARLISATEQICARWVDGVHWQNVKVYMEGSPLRRFIDAIQHEVALLLLSKDPEFASLTKDLNNLLQGPELTIVVSLMNYHAKNGLESISTIDKKTLLSSFNAQELDDAVKTFRRLALKIHPDRVAPGLKEKAEEFFKIVSAFGTRAQELRNKERQK